MPVDNNRNLVAAISYLFGFITGIVVLFTEERDKFIRFHAMQSATSTGFLFLFNIVLGLILGRFGVLVFVADLVGIVAWLLILLICIFGFVFAWQGKIFKLPFFGNFSENRVRKS